MTIAAVMPVINATGITTLSVVVWRIKVRRDREREEIHGKIEEVREEVEPSAPVRSFWIVE